MVQIMEHSSEIYVEYQKAAEWPRLNIVRFNTSQSFHHILVQSVQEGIYQTQTRRQIYHTRDSRLEGLLTCLCDLS